MWTKSAITTLVTPAIPCTPVPIPWRSRRDELPSRGQSLLEVFSLILQRRQGEIGRGPPNIASLIVAPASVLNP